MTAPGEFVPYPSSEGAHVGFAPGSESPPNVWRRYRSDLLAFAVVVAACLVVGALVGLVWEQVTPHWPLKATKDGVFSSTTEPETSIAQDGWFAVCSIVAGIVLAPLAFWRFRRQGVATAVGLALGGVAGAYLAFRIGVWLGPDDILEQVRKVGLNKEFDHPLDLQAKGILYLWPIASMVIFLGLSAGFAPADKPAPRYVNPYLSGWNQGPGGSDARPVDLFKHDTHADAAAGHGADAVGHDADVDLTKRPEDQG
ncbi:hypothetical protein [Streptomyces sp. SID3343]|uniref:hypothetical protein n=1 Tax=Streptomyces sp. SID3343 TaxID=2690260 RepID=UPI00136955B1|nr:hypothetical protein [Streptomyces sp. SID3343]MYW03940.1 hypothetical protein [Streptomyces sp. SID3343]